MTEVGSWQYSTTHNCACKVIDADGKPLFKPRHTELAQIRRERLTRERDKGAYAFTARLDGGGANE